MLLHSRLPQGRLASEQPRKHASEACMYCAGNESHSGQVFCCVAALAIAGSLDRLDSDLLCWW